MLKETQYRCWGSNYGPGIPRFNKVVYAIVGKSCYFSGIERTLRTSTINAAESIIAAICAQEKVHRDRLRWFDLQTHRGYESKGLGEFELDELTIRPNPAGAKRGGAKATEIDGIAAFVITQDTYEFVVDGWSRTLCPPEIYQLFREYINS